MAKTIDIHIHLTDNEYQSIPWLMQSFLKFYNCKMVSASVDLDTAIRSVKLAQEFPGKVIPFLGIHPQMVEKVDLDKFLEYLYANNTHAVGVGEIGLDRKLDSKSDPSEKQMLFFRKQLEAAEKLGKPIAVHSRGTLKEVMNILPSYRLNGVLLHWFAGTENDLARAMNYGFYVSYGPTLVYSKSKQKLASSTPKDSILTETDGPVSYQGCFGGKPALPTFLPSVLFALASILKIPYDETTYLVQQNSERYLRITF